MTSDYEIEVHYETRLPGEKIAYKTVHQRFCVSFAYTWVAALDSRKITTCCLIELPSKKIYAGGSIKNHIDSNDEWLGRRWAYKRAVLMLWIIWMQLHKTILPFKPFWQMFRQALADNSIYLEERIKKDV
jgi:hypothetical protein